MSIKAELRAIFDGNELTSPHDIVAWAASRRTSALYKELKFDDNKTAAALWRISHARALISIHIVDVERRRETISLSIDRHEDGGYRQIVDVLETPNLRSIALSDALKDLEQRKQKYEDAELFELTPIWEALEDVAKGLRPRRRIGEGVGAEVGAVTAG